MMAINLYICILFMAFRSINSLKITHQLPLHLLKQKTRVESTILFSSAKSKKSDQIDGCQVSNLLS